MCANKHKVCSSKNIYTVSVWARYVTMNYANEGYSVNVCEWLLVLINVDFTRSGISYINLYSSIY